MIACVLFTRRMFSLDVFVPAEREITGDTSFSSILFGTYAF